MWRVRGKSCLCFTRIKRARSGADLNYPRIGAEHEKGRPLESDRPHFIRVARLSGDGVLHLLGSDRVAARKRLEDLAGELEHRLAELRAFGDDAVELALRKLALEAEEIARRLHVGEAAKHARRFLEALAAVVGGLLGERLDAARRDLGRSDQRLDVAAGEFGHLLDDPRVLLERG